MLELFQPQRGDLPNRPRPQPARGAGRSAPVVAPLPRQCRKWVTDRPAPHIIQTALTRGAPEVEPTCTYSCFCFELVTWFGIPLSHACVPGITVQKLCILKAAGICILTNC